MSTDDYDRHKHSICACTGLAPYTLNPRVGTPLIAWTMHLHISSAEWTVIAIKGIESTSWLIGGAISTVGSVTPPPTTALPAAAGTATGSTRLCRTAEVRSLLRDLLDCSAPLLDSRGVAVVPGNSRPAPRMMP